MKTVLVIDDMESELELIEVYLQQEGYTVITAINGQEGFQKAVAENPDAIVTDLVMPEMTGLELCRKLKRTPSTAHIPVIACTTRDRGVDQSWAMKQGVAAYLIKPCTQEQLVSSIQSVMG
jgi:two-component system, chemotaxis family, response regulator PixH